MTLREALPGPTTSGERVLAPDLARGALLALIALANSAVFLHGRPYGPRQHVIEDGLLDRIVSVITVTLVDGRAYPMFAALFAYGLVRNMRRLRASGVPEPDATRTLRRRNRWLIGFGFVHAVLLFPGDVLGLYGLLGFAVLALLRASDRTLLRTAAAWLLVVATVQGFAYLTPIASTERSFFWSFAVTDPFEALALRPLEWLMTPLGMLGVGSAALIGVWAARRGVLDEPRNHRALLRRTAVTGLALGVVGGLPMALAVGGFWHPGGAYWLASAAHAVSGVAAGIGYGALAGSLAIKLTGPGRQGALVTAIVACGRRSLSCYLFQSVVFAVLLLPFTLGLGATLGSASVAMVALGTWLVSVLLAEVLRRAGKNGPAENLLRGLTYRTLRH
ncbi:hypothetical protein BAY61_05515 [Prauserella marina]|uniref:Uncharacterized membrane protein YeiB n=1 Tax=Prauserella marina TaxID=530584 RepID=A0A222VKW6_9PSEU|nr:DUF418 domain-containing protein [Prauserella marina]ASR34537.1 hypothetical protein BAY61_05515 [Prauserella marina]PWV85855.1 putative membrane protein YeiB [Prauserella marina]SDC43851.1 Uncharacterized membrane protein YeiB [Prauserella marina]